MCLEDVPENNYSDISPVLTLLQILHMLGYQIYVEFPN